MHSRRRIATLLAVLALSATMAGPASAHEPTHHDENYVPAGTWVIMYEDAGGNGDHWLRYKSEGPIPDLSTRLDHLVLSPVSCSSSAPTGSTRWSNCISSYSYRLGTDWCLRWYDSANYHDKISTKKSIGTSTLVWNFTVAGADNDRFTSFKWAPFDYDSGTCLFNDGEGG